MHQSVMVDFRKSEEIQFKFEAVVTKGETVLALLILQHAVFVYIIFTQTWIGCAVTRAVLPCPRLYARRLLFSLKYIVSPSTNLPCQC